MPLTLQKLENWRAANGKRSGRNNRTRSAFFSAAAINGSVSTNCIANVRRSQIGCFTNADLRLRDGKNHTSDVVVAIRGATPYNIENHPRILRISDSQRLAACCDCTTQARRRESYSPSDRARERGPICLTAARKRPTLVAESSDRLRSRTLVLNLSGKARGAGTAQDVFVLDSAVALLSRHPQLVVVLKHRPPVS
jgi:hypothetical protein